MKDTGNGPYEKDVYNCPVSPYGWIGGIMFDLEEKGFMIGKGTK